MTPGISFFFFVPKKKKFKKKIIIIGIVGYHLKNPEMLSEKGFEYYMVLNFLLKKMKQKFIF